jgi:hypothetical protein
MMLTVALAHATKVAVLALLAGILVRGKARQCWSFVAYLVAVLLANTLISMGPEYFSTPAFWVVKQRIYDVLKMAIALELAWRVFEAFPGAWRTARRVLSVVLAVSTLAIASLLPHASYTNVYDWQPRATTAAIWLLAATALVVVRYQIPIRDWQRAIMLGFAPYLLVCVTLMGLLKRHGWSFRVQWGLTDAIAYVALLLFWNYAVWRVERRPEVAAADLEERAA